MDRSPWVLVWKSSDGSLLVKQHRDTHEVIVVTGSHTGHFKIEAKDLTLIYST
jgi:hypothetical protein